MDFPDFEEKVDVAILDENFELDFVLRSFCPEFQIFVKEKFFEVLWVDSEEEELKSKNVLIKRGKSKIEE